MKKKIALTICTAALLLTGCRADSAMLIEYSDLNILSSSDVLSLIPAQTSEPYSTDIAVIDYTPETDSAEAETDPSSDTTAETDTSSNTQNDYGEPSSETPGLLVDMTNNEVLYNNLPYKEVAPASLTKMMTALLTLKYGNLDDSVTLTSEMNQDMISGAQVCGFVPGDTITVKELLYSMLVFSGNDAANALAIHVGGSISAFVDMMNEEANLLGAVNTHFSNPSGLDVDNHYSSAYDLYLIFNACMAYDDFSTAICQPSYTTHYTNSSGDAASVTFTSTNLYMDGTYSSPDGVTVYGGKTGTTEAAGACLLAYSHDDAGNEYVSLSLGSADKPELYSQMNKILAKILN